MSESKTGAEKSDPIVDRVNSLMQEKHLNTAVGKRFIEEYLKEKAGNGVVQFADRPMPGYSAWIQVMDKEGKVKMKYGDGSMKGETCSLVSLEIVGKDAKSHKSSEESKVIANHDDDGKPHQGPRKAGCHAEDHLIYRGKSNGPSPM